MQQYQYVVSVEKGRQFSHGNTLCRVEAVQSPCSPKDLPSPQGLEWDKLGEGVASGIQTLSLEVGWRGNQPRELRWSLLAAPAGRFLAPSAL